MVIGLRVVLPKLYSLSPITITYRHEFRRKVPQWKRILLSLRDYNDNEKESIGAISNEENHQNVDVFTMANVQNSIFAQRQKTQLKKKKKKKAKKLKKKERKKEKIGFAL